VVVQMNHMCAFMLIFSYKTVQHIILPLQSGTYSKNYTVYFCYIK